MNMNWDEDFGQSHDAENTVPMTKAEFERPFRGKIMVGPDGSIFQVATPKPRKVEYSLSVSDKEFLTQCGIAIDD